MGNGVRTCRGKVGEEIIETRYSKVPFHERDAQWQRKTAALEERPGLLHSPRTCENYQTVEQSLRGRFLLLRQKRSQARLEHSPACVTHHDGQAVVVLNARFSFVKSALNADLLKNFAAVVGRIVASDPDPKTNVRFQGETS